MKGKKRQVGMYHATINAIGVSRHSVRLRRCGITDVGHSVSIRTYTLNECKHIVRTHVELIPDVEERHISGGLEKHGNCRWSRWGYAEGNRDRYMNYRS